MRAAQSGSASSAAPSLSRLPQMAALATPPTTLPKQLHKCKSVSITLMDISITRAPQRSPALPARFGALCQEPPRHLPPPSEGAVPGPRLREGNGTAVPARSWRDGSGAPCSAQCQRTGTASGPGWIGGSRERAELRGVPVLMIPGISFSFALNVWWT